MSDQINLEDFFSWFGGSARDGLPWQKDAVALLFDELPGHLKQNDSDWVALFRNKQDLTADIITPELLARLTGRSSEEFSQRFCLDFNVLLSDTGFDRHPALQMLMANILHETGGLLYLRELASGQAYNNRQDLENGPTEGPKYKGAGVLMLTGRYNYSRAAERLVDPKILELGVDYVAKNYPFTSAIPWIEDNDLLHICLTEGFDACCYKINGGWRGYQDRIHWYRICQRELK